MSATPYADALKEQGRVVGAVHFSVDFEWLTKFIRDLWTEGSFKQALDVLESSNCPERYHKDILRGKKKMVGIDEGHIENDNWQPREPDRYFDPDLLPKLAQDGERYKREYFRLLGNEYALLVRRWKSASSGKELEDLSYQFKAFPSEFIQSLDPTEQLPYINAMRANDLGFYAARNTYEMLTGNEIASVNVEQFIRHQIELDKKPAPKPDTRYESDYGWITSGGLFYPCLYFEHIWLAGVLGKTEAEADESGWIKIGYSKTLGEPVIHCWSTEKVTQPQLDALWQWCARRKIPMPEWAKQ